MVDFAKINAANKAKREVAARDPNTKIDAKARSAAAERSDFALEVQSDDPMRSFTRAELRELRQRMLWVQTRADGPNQLQAMRMVTLIDQHDHSVDLSANISNAITNAALEGLKDAIEQAEESLHRELGAEHEDEINELDDPAPWRFLGYVDQDPEKELVSATVLIRPIKIYSVDGSTPAERFYAWYQKRIAALKTEITNELAPVLKAVKDAEAAFEDFE